MKHLGSKPFHVRTGLNAAVFDSVLVAFAENQGTVPSDIKSRYENLKKDAVYDKRTRSATTDKEAVEDRLRIARKILFS